MNYLLNEIDISRNAHDVDENQLQLAGSRRGESLVSVLYEAYSARIPPDYWH